MSKKGRVPWGFDGGKVIVGGLAFVAAGGLQAALFLFGGYIYFWLVGVAIIGFIAMVTGLLGDEGTL